jgi:hypothetical protein
MTVRSTPSVTLSSGLGDVPPLEKNPQRKNSGTRSRRRQLVPPLVATRDPTTKPHIVLPLGTPVFGLFSPQFLFAANRIMPARTTWLVAPERLRQMVQTGTATKVRKWRQM